MDSTGGLVQIPKKNRIYQKIFNYFLLLKDLRNFDDEDMREKSVLITELVSSRHTVYAITTFLRFLKMEFERIYKTRISFRILVIDYSWPEMHASLEVFNLDTIETYSKHVYRIATAPLSDDMFEKRTWLCSCASHTMHRFVNHLKPLTKNKEIKDLCCFSFSLLMNCQDLDAMNEIYRVILYVFLSTSKTTAFKLNYKKLNAFLEHRPSFKQTVEEVRKRRMLKLNIFKSSSKIYFIYSRLSKKLKNHLLVSENMKQMNHLKTNQPFLDHLMKKILNKT